MSDARDVVDARSEANAARRNAQAYGSSIEDGRTSDPALATLLAAEAVCCEIRLQTTYIDYLYSKGLGNV